MTGIRSCLTPQHSLPTADQCRGYPFKRPWLWLLAAHAKKLRSRRSNGASSHRGSFPDLSLLSLVNCSWSSLLPRVHISRELCQSVPRSSSSKRCCRRSRGSKSPSIHVAIRWSVDVALTSCLLGWSIDGDRECHHIGSRLADEIN